MQARFVLDFEFAGALFDGVFECLGKGSELCEGALSFRYVDADADDAYGATVGVVKQVIARLHPFQFAVARAHDAKFAVHLPLPRGKRGIEQVGDSRHILTEDALSQQFVTPVEVGQAVQRKEPGGQPHHAGLHLPLEYADAAGLLRQREKLFGFLQARRSSSGLELFLPGRGGVDRGFTRACSEGSIRPGPAWLPSWP